MKALLKNLLEKLLREELEEVKEIYAKIQKGQGKEVRRSFKQEFKGIWGGVRKECTTLKGAKFLTKRVLYTLFGGREKVLTTVRWIIKIILFSCVPPVGPGGTIMLILFLRDTFKQVFPPHPKQQD